MNVRFNLSYDIKIILKSHFWSKKVKILSLCMQFLHVIKRFSCMALFDFQMEYLYVGGRESKPRNSDFNQKDVLSKWEYQTHGAHSVEFSKL